MRIRGAIAALAASAAAAGCHFGAGAEEGRTGGPQAARSYDLAGFDAVALGGPHHVTVSVGPQASVRAEGPQHDLERLELRLDGSTLEIRTKHRGGWWKGRDSEPVRVHVTMPAIRKAAIGGSGDMRIDRVAGEAFSATVGGSGDMEVGDMQVKTADFSIAGSGNIRAAGSAEQADMSIAGSGDLGLERLQARRASVSIVGSGDVRAHATEAADVSIMGSGDVDIAGGAHCSVSKQGSGDVRCGA